MPKFIISFLLISISFLSSFGQSVVQMSMAEINSTNAGGWSMLMNPAGLSTNEKNTALLSYFTDHIIHELDKKMLAASFSFYNKAGGISLLQYGDKRLSISDLRYSYSQAFGEHLAAAAGVNTLLILQESYYGQKLLVYSHFGFLLSADGRNEIGILLENPERAELNEELNNKLPSQISMSLSHHFSPSFRWIGEISLSSRQNHQIKSAILYRITEVISLSSAINFQKRLFSFSSEFKIKYFDVLLAFSYQSRIGFTNGIGIAYQFQK